jgi:predicted permease
MYIIKGGKMKNTDKLTKLQHFKYIVIYLVAILLWIIAISFITAKLNNPTMNTTQITNTVLKAKPLEKP